MNKEHIITFINNYYQNKITPEESLIFITEYCELRGKKQEDIAQLLKVLSYMPLEIPVLLDYIIHWYAVQLQLTILSKIRLGVITEHIKIF